MRLVRDLVDLPDKFRQGAVSIGNFDGVHLGHARIVERLLAKARSVGGPAVIFTFDPHPVRILRPDQAPPPLTWTDRKADLLAELGVDAVVAYPTDEELLARSADRFFQSIVIERLGARAMVEGTNFFFGHNRAGTIEVLGDLCRQARIELDIVAPLEIGGEPVSSSRVRRLLAAGDVDQARGLLTRPYRLRGMVVHGAGRGLKVGFGTANLNAIDTVIPGEGVYAGNAYVNGQRWPAAIHIGPNPTFGEHAPKLEVHLIGWREPLYGQPLEVDFVSRLRDIQRFGDVDQLKRQLHLDVAAASDILAGDR